MVTPISVRLDSDVRAILEEEARAKGVGISTFLRDLATAAARQARRDRIRRQSKAVGEYVARSTEAKAFYDEVGSAHFDAV